MVKVSAKTKMPRTNGTLLNVPMKWELIGSILVVIVPSGRRTDKE